MARNCQLVQSGQCRLEHGETQAANANASKPRTLRIHQCLISSRIGPPSITVCTHGQNRTRIRVKAVTKPVCDRSHNCGCRASPLCLLEVDSVDDFQGTALPWMMR